LAGCHCLCNSGLSRLMSGPAEEGCLVKLQQHSLEYPGASTSTIRLLHFDREFEAADSKSGKYSHIPNACLLFLSCGDCPCRMDACLSAWGKRGKLKCLRTSHCLSELLSSLQKAKCTCLLWRGCRTQVAQHTSVAICLSSRLSARGLSFTDRTPIDAKL